MPPQFQAHGITKTVLGEIGCSMQTADAKQTEHLHIGKGGNVTVNSVPVAYGNHTTQGGATILFQRYVCEQITKQSILEDSGMQCR